MSFPRYPKYKPSGVEWLGEVPEHWTVERTDRRVRTTRNAIDAPALDGLRVFHYSIPVLQETGDGQFEDGASIESSKIVISRPCVLVSKLNPRKGTACIALPKRELTVCSGELVPLEPLDADLSFVYFIALSEQYRCRLESMVESVTRSHQRVLASDVVKFRWAFPPLAEQRTIAAFLDRETAKLDALIVEQEKLIELLAEKRQAVISHAVTKGLNPAAPMKPSGVEWLGDVPAHWEVRPLRTVASIVRGASPRPAGDPRYFNGDAVPWVTVAEITKDDRTHLTETETSLTTEGAAASRLFPGGTLLYSNSGATLGVPKILGMDACANDGVVGFLDQRSDVRHLFLLQFLNSITVAIREKVKQGSGQPNLNTDIVKAIQLAVPPAHEQDELVRWMECQTREILRLRENTQRAIDLLRERRSALISAAVTGQIDVRNAVPETAA